MLVRDDSTVMIGRAVLCISGLVTGCGAPSDEGADFDDLTEVGDRQSPLVTQRIPVAADAEVRSGSPTTRYGHAVEIGSDQSPGRQSYLRFNVAVNGRIASATLRCFARNGSVKGPALHPTGSAWDEGTVVWNSRPAVTGPALTTLGHVPHGSWVEVDVSSVVRSNGTYSFSWVPTSTDSMICDSRERGGNAPELVLGIEPAPLRFRPVADAEVKAGSPGQNFGSSTVIGADGDPRRRAFLRFAVSGVTGEVSRATLRCNVANGSTRGPSLYRTTGSWSEQGVTWNSQPSLTGGAIASSGAVAYKSVLEFDVTSVVRGNGTYDFGLLPTSTDSVECQSRETGSNGPELVVTTEGSAPSSPGWALYWADEFNGTALDTRVWTPYHNTYGDGNNELPCLTPNNVSVSGGALHIVARRQNVTCPNGSTRRFTSGFIGTREKGVYFPRYGRYEIRAKLPHMHALWPAFWLRHRNGSSVTEVDVMEYFHMQAPGKTTSTLHYNHKYNVAKGSAYFESPTLSPGFHTWAVEIEPKNGQVCFQYFLDDKAITFHGAPAGQPYCLTDVGPFAAHPGQNLFDIAVNMAVGGNWVGDPDGPLDTLMNGTKVSTAGVQPTTFPTEYVVDYVRVYVRE